MAAGRRDPSREVDDLSSRSATAGRAFIRNCSPRFPSHWPRPWHAWLPSVRVCVTTLRFIADPRRLRSTADGGFRLTGS
jgi:hypothetical protein